MSSQRSILFVHQNFPGQFPRIAEALLRRGDRVVAIGAAAAPGLAGVEMRRWGNRRSSTDGIFPPAVRAEADLIRAGAAAQAAAALAAEGFVPDIIVGNPAWGETVHLKEIWPAAKLVLLGEYWYTSKGGDADFDPEFASPIGLAEAIDLNARNMGHALAYTLADRIVCPTPFQASTFPPSLRERITVHHEGVDVHRAARRPDASVTLPDGRVLDASTPVVTFASRTLEPLRGFHMFMRALPEVLAADPRAEAIVIGKDAARGYGAAAPGGGTWKDRMLAEVGDRLDLTRVHFLGRVPHATLIDAFSISSAHVYLTYPFVLSWSLIEAMACECVVIGSDTTPVRDAIVPGVNGLLTDFFDHRRLAALIGAALSSPTAFIALRAAARATVLIRYDSQRQGVPGWLDILDAI